MFMPMCAATLPVDAFVGRLHEVCGEFNVQPMVGGKSVKGGVNSASFSGIEIAVVSANVDRIARTPDCVRRQAGENYFLILQEYGTAVMNQAGNSASLGTGDMVLIDSARPSEFIFSGGFSQQISLHLPRSGMQQRFGTLMENGFAMKASDPLALAMHAILAKILAPTNMEAASGYLGEALLSVLGAALVEQSGSSWSGINCGPGDQQALAQVLEHIDRHCGDPDLTVARMASDLRLSPRQLQRLFQRIGETPTERLLARRLEMARTRLMERAMGWRRKSVASIAYDCGFNDLSYFSRAFKSRFGCTPGNYEG